MRIIKLLLTIFLLLFFYFKFLKGLIMKDNKQYQCYGVTNNFDLISAIMVVSNFFSLGAKSTKLALNLYEIAITESNLASAIYNPDRGFGYGPYQFDPVAWKDIRQRFVNNPNLANEVLVKFWFDPRNTEYAQLKTHIIKSTVYARAYLYFRIPSAIGDSMAERAQQWATYYNTPAGASKGKPDLYIKRVNAYKNDPFIKFMGNFE